MVGAAVEAELEGAVPDAPAAGDVVEGAAVVGGVVVVVDSSINAAMSSLSCSSTVSSTNALSGRNSRKPTTATNNAAPTRAHLYFPMNDWVSAELLLDPPFDSAIPGAYRPPFTDCGRVGSSSARSASLCRWTLVRP